MRRFLLAVTGLLGFAAPAPGAGAARRLLCAFAISFIALVSLSTHAWSQPVTIARVVPVSGSTDSPFAAICQIHECTYTDISEFHFSALAVPQLAQYDLLFFGWDLAPTLDADWQTRLGPYLEAGGSVIFESAYNVHDLDGLVSGSLYEDGSPFVVANVPGLTDGISHDLYNSHMRFAAWAPELSPFITTHDGAVVGLYGSVGDGRIVITGPDNGYHGVPGGWGSAANMFALLANEVAWTTGLALSPIPEPQTYALLLAGLALLGFAARRRLK